MLFSDVHAFPAPVDHSCAVEEIFYNLNKLSPSDTCCFQTSTPSPPLLITPVSWKVFYSIHVVFRCPCFPCPRRSLSGRGRYSILYMLFSDVHAFPAPVDHSRAVEGILFYTCCFQMSMLSLPLSITLGPWKVFYSIHVVFRCPCFPCPCRSLSGRGRYSILYMLFSDVHAFPAPVDHSRAVEGILFYTYCFQMSTPSLPPSITPVPWKVFYSIHILSDVHAFPAPVDHSLAVEENMLVAYILHVVFRYPRLPGPCRSLSGRGRYSILYILFSDVHAFPAPVDHSCAVEGILFYTCCFQTSMPSLPPSITPVPLKKIWRLSSMKIDR